MRLDAKVEVTAGVLAAMNTTQFEALQQNILQEGQWETVDDCRLSGYGEYVGVNIGGMFIGIEKDGYTHS